ncbi:MAG: hypothetical protein QOE61_3717 [Micromonosporaceae bacterium]|nr:hypothetical protein [Micromonosporaceae bacterium]
MPATRPKPPPNQPPPPQQPPPQQQPPPAPAPVPEGVDFYGGYWLPVHGGGYAWHTGTLDSARPYTQVYNMSLESMLNPMVYPNGKTVPYRDGNYTNSNYTGEFWPDGTPNANYIPPDPATVNVGLNPVLPPIITGNPRTSDGNGAPPPPQSDFNAYSVDPGSMRDAEMGMRAPVENTITVYEDTKHWLDAQKGWLYSFDNAAVPGMTYGSGRNGGPPAQIPMYQQGNPAAVAQMIAANDAALQSVTDVVELAGVYMATLNDAAQVFAEADKKSFVPNE